MLLTRPGLPKAMFSGTTNSASSPSTFTSTPFLRSASSCGSGVVVGFAAAFDLTVHHAVRAVADDGELLRDAGVYVGVITAIRRQFDADCGQELVVGDVLLFGRHDASGDLELQLLRQRLRELIHDPVMLAGEQRLHRREGDVLVGPHVSSDDGVLRSAPEASHQVHRGCCRRVAAGVPAREIAARQQQLRAVVSEVVIDGALAHPLQAVVAAAVDRRGIHVRRHRVCVGAWRGHTGAPHRRRPSEGDAAEVVGEVLERVVVVERERRVVRA